MQVRHPHVKHFNPLTKGCKYGSRPSSSQAVQSIQQFLNVNRGGFHPAGASVTAYLGVLQMSPHHRFDATTLKAAFHSRSAVIARCLGHEAEFSMTYIKWRTKVSREIELVSLLSYAKHYLFGERLSVCLSACLSHHLQLGLFMFSSMIIRLKLSTLYCLFNLYGTSRISWPLTMLAVNAPAV